MSRAAAIGVAGVLALALTTLAGAAETSREVHGSADAFATQGVALAWAVLRAQKDDDAAVVIRIDVDTQTYSQIEVIGKDPFTQHEEWLQTPIAVGGAFDLRVPRSRFADFPRTEIRLWRRGRDAAPPDLIVYYLGVPDTTPEVAQGSDLDRSLTSRLIRAREDSARKAQ
jgi:hypothetical protein